MVVLGLIFVAAGLGVATYSGIVAARAASGRQIPLWRNRSGYRAPPATQILQLVAVLIVGFGSILCFLEWGISAIFLVVSVFVLPFVVAALHNKVVQEHE